MGAYSADKGARAEHCLNTPSEGEQLGGSGSTSSPSPSSGPGMRNEERRRSALARREPRDMLRALSGVVM